MKKLSPRQYAPVLTSLFTLVVYMLTMSRGIMPIDAGELAASQYSLGISHPSGYPLFNILGFLWGHIPIGSVIFRLNFLCAIWVASGNFFMVKTAFLVLEKTIVKPVPITDKNKTLKTVSLPPGNPFLLQLLAAISGILVLAFTRTYWLQSAGVEVYSLHIALVAAFFFTFTRFYYLPVKTLKDWAICGLILGLCFTNHLTSLLILPGTAVLLLVYLFNSKESKKNIQGLLILSGVFLLVFLSFYIFMMYRADASPLVNYGNPDNIEYLKRHISGWQFQSFFNQEKKGNKALDLFLSGLTGEMGLPGILFMLAGVVWMLMKNRWMAIFWILHFISALVYASRYDIHDIENYFLLCYMSAGIWTACGIYWLLQLPFFAQQKTMALVVFLVPVFALVVNFSKVDQSHITYVDDYARTALESVDKNAIIISREWDVFVSPAYYYQKVENIRPDVLIIDKELLRRSWYFNQLKRWDPVFAASIEPEANAFNEAVLPFERGDKINPEDIQQKFERYILKITGAYTKRPVYISSLVYDADLSQGVDVKLPAGASLIPETYFFRVVPMDTVTYYPLPVPLSYPINFTEQKDKDRFQQQVLRFSMSVLSARVMYEMSFGKKEEAKRILQIMREADPRVKIPPGLE